MSASLKLKRTVIDAMRLRDPTIVPALDSAAVLAFTDPAGLSLFLPVQMLDDRGREALAARLESNCQRVRALRQLYAEIADRLSAAHIPFVFLKGLRQCELSGHDPERRVQYDIDVLTTPDRSQDLLAALEPLGFAPYTALTGYSGEHLPPLIRRTGWEFRGDFFDPEIPVSIEPHLRLWDHAGLRLAAPGVGGFFERRRAGFLAPADALGHAALHLLKHLLLGSVRPFHIFELACVLERQHRNLALWDAWRSDHPAALRRLQCLSFRLAQTWFGCRLPEAVEEDWAALPPAARTWFDVFPWSPLAASNKDELWLHAALLASPRDRAAIFFRRLLPPRPPAPVDGVYLTPAQRTVRRRVLQAARQARFTAGRALHHARAALRLAVSGARWWRRLHWPRVETRRPALS